MKYQLLTGLVFLYSISLAQNTLPNSGNIGIGTTSPRAALDVAVDISNEKLGTVFGRLSEGDWEKSGTFLGVKGFETQFTGYGGKSFSIVHNFYGDTNSSINFYRGGGRTGGFMTFNTNEDIERLRISTSGNVGIGTTNPDQKLTVKGGIGFEHNSLDKKLYSPEDGLLEWMTHNAAGIHGFSISHQGAKAVYLNTSGISYINGGNLGIGTTLPTEKLEVNGKIRAREIKVEASPWPDYVFAKDYHLPSLAEIEKHIKEKGHLPGIPTAAEVKANGINLGEMNAKLLQKIEELTLQLINQSKIFESKLTAQQQEINKLKKKK